MKENAVVQTQELKKVKMGFKVRLAVLISALAAMMSLGAFASEGEGSSGGDFTAVMGSMSTLSSLMTQVWNMMTSNPLLVLFLAVMLLGIGVSVFRMIKRAARR